MLRQIIAICLCFCLLLSSGCYRQNEIAETTSESTNNFPDTVYVTIPVTSPVEPPVSMIPKLPRSLNFAGEEVPLHYFDVKESLERELTILSYWHATMLYILQLSGRWFPVIKPILAEENVPEDFIYLCVAESSLQNLVSPVGAAGFWQFMKGTAKDYHLEVSDAVDERYNLEKATRAACAYLKESHAKYKSWTLAAASYNMGSHNTGKRIDQQGESNYYNMHLPVETSRYLFRILAFKLLMNDPANYGYNLDSANYYKPLLFKKAEVNHSIESLSDFARQHHTNYKMLKLYNPWLRDRKLPVKGNKHYTLLLPTDDARIQDRKESE